MKKPTAKLERITPTKAKKWLTELNYEDNRNINERKVAFIARQIVGGHWIVNGATICFDVEGNMIDGQHRLQGCVKSKKPIEAFVVRGLQTAAYTTIDQGWKRSHSQIFSAKGEKWAGCLVSACKFIWNYESEGKIIRPRLPEISVDEVEVVLEYKPEIRAAVELVMTSKCQKLATASVMAYAAWIFLQINDEKAIDFFNRIGDGVGLAKGSPMLIIRDKLLKGRKDKTSWNPQEIFSFLVRAWNAHYRSRKITCLRLTTKGRGGSKTIEIPKISGWKA